MVVYEKIYFKAYTNDQYTSHKKYCTIIFYISVAHATLFAFHLVVLL